MAKCYFQEGPQFLLAYNGNVFYFIRVTYNWTYNDFDYFDDIAFATTRLWLAHEKAV